MDLIGNSPDSIRVSDIDISPEWSYYKCGFSKYMEWTRATDAECSSEGEIAICDNLQKWISVSLLITIEIGMVDDNCNRDKPDQTATDKL